MKPLFADTSYLLALINPGDAHHPRALQIHETGTEPLVTTHWVLTEAGDALCAPANRQRFRRLLELFHEQPDVLVIPASLELWDRGCALYFHRADKAWSLTDCISFVVVEERRITDALTADHHFEQAGFRALMRG